jgi:hypothetical protein
MRVKYKIGYQQIISHFGLKHSLSVCRQSRQGWYGATLKRPTSVRWDWNSGSLALAGGVTPEQEEEFTFTFKH